MKIAIVGGATEGIASCTFFMNRGDDVTICDQDTSLKLPYGSSGQLGEHYLDNLDRFDVIVRSAGIHPSVILSKNPNVGDKITSQVNEFIAQCPTRNIIGVTGTKGKGTTSTLIAKMLEAAGKKVFLGGNIGVPVFDFIGRITASDWVVIELSSFQLIDLKHSPHIGVCLMVVPEHLDWHEDFEEYVSAKQQLFMNQGEDDIAIYYADNEDSESIAHASEGTIIPFMEKPGAVIENDAVKMGDKEICKTSEIKLLGEHNWQNVCAAITAVWQATQDIAAMRSIITSFEGLEHRLEFVRELDGVRYYNDSFGTTPETAMVAIQAFDQPKVLILGGSTKNANFDDLARVVAANQIRHIILVGNTTHPSYSLATPEIEAALRARKITNITSLVRPNGVTMNEIVNNSREQALPGDVILLSTGCASFDTFQNYKDRGEQFKKSVQSLV